MNNYYNFKPIANIFNYMIYKNFYSNFIDNENVNDNSKW